MTKTRDLADLGGGFIQADATVDMQRTVESKLQDFVSITDFGADPTGTNDSKAAIQAALNTGKAVLVPSGTFRVLSTLGIAAHGQKLYGLGNTSILKDETGVNNFINVDTKNNVTISDLKVDASVGSAAGIAIRSGSKNVVIENVYFYKGGQQVWLFACDTVRVINCTFEETGYGIIQQTGHSSSDVLVSNNTAINVVNDFVEANCASTPSFNWVISNNIYEGCRLWPTPQTESRFIGITGVNGVVITGNTAKRVCGDAAVHLEDIGGEVVISGNYFVDVLGTGYIYVLHTAENCVITGNIFEHLDATITPAPAVWCLNNYSPEIVFSGNRVKGIAAAKTFDAFAVGFFGGHLIIADNIFDTLDSVLTDPANGNVSLTGNKFIDCTNPLVKVGGSSTSFRDFLIANNVFTGTTGAHDIWAGANASGTGAPKRCLVTGNKFCSQVQFYGDIGHAADGDGDAADIQVVNNVFSSAASLVAPSGTMSRLIYSENIFEGTGDYSAAFHTVTAAGDVKIGGTLPAIPNILLRNDGLIATAYIELSSSPTTSFITSTGGRTLICRAGPSLGVQLTTGATAWAPVTSESRLKDFQSDVDVDQCWNLIRDIQLKRYYYKDQDDKSGVSYMGPMADWLGLQDPELLIDTGRTDEHGAIHTYNQGLLDMKALSALSAALQRIEQLEAKVATLEGA
jgi:hypothetical protein